MRVIPVLDLLESVVVRGVAGKRDAYRPLESDIAVSASPRDVARAFREHFGLNTLYVADLDAILHGELNQTTLRELADDGFELLVDAGIRNANDADVVLAAGASRVIVALETWPLLSSLELLIRRLGSERLLFSLDLRAGQLVRTFHDLTASEPLDVAASVLEAGISDLIVLDVAAVGLAEGVPTLPLCRSILQFAPKSRLITGGGIRSAGDLSVLAENGLDGALAASALHNGSISPAEISQLEHISAGRTLGGNPCSAPTPDRASGST